MAGNYRLAAEHPAGAVDVALDEMAAEPGVDPGRPLEVHRRSRRHRAERAATQGLEHDVGAECAVDDVDDEEPAGTDGDLLALMD